MTPRQLVIATEPYPICSLPTGEFNMAWSFAADKFNGGENIGIACKYDGSIYFLCDGITDKVYR